eukprot:849825-Prorocentrum_lima.AAC.1
MVLFLSSSEPENAEDTGYVFTPAMGAPGQIGLHCLAELGIASMLADAARSFPLGSSARKS